MKKVIPLILIELYLGATYLIYRYGMWMYPYRDDNRTAFFVIAVMVAFCIGYVLPLKKMKNKENREQRISDAFVYVLCTIGALLMIPYCYSKTFSIYPTIFTSIQDLSTAYANATNATQTAGLLHIVGGVGRPFAYYLFFITYYYWKDLGRRVRWLALIETIWFVLVDMSTGHNVGIFSYCIMLIIMYTAWLCKEKKVDKKKVIKRTAITALAIMIMPVYFGSSLSSRGAATQREMEMSVDVGEFTDIFTQNPELLEKMEKKYGYKQPVIIEKGEGLDCISKGMIPREVADRYEKHKKIAAKEHPYYIDPFTFSYVDVNGNLYKTIPKKLRFLVTEGSYYVSHGYYGVSIGLRLPYETDYGLGTFIILQGIFKKLFGIDFYNKSFVYKINHAGYPISLKWGTAFTQFASDVSYPGVPLVMVVLGALLSILWYEVTKENRVLSLLILVPLGFYMVMIVSWWHPGLSGSDFLMLNAPLGIWIIVKIIQPFLRKEETINK